MEGSGDAAASSSGLWANDQHTPEAVYRGYSRRASRESMEESFDEENSVDLSYSDLDSFPTFLLEKTENVKSLQLDHNLITVLPRCIGSFKQLVALDISNNQMAYLSVEIVHLQQLRTLTARNNQFDNDSIPKEIGQMEKLQVLNFSGNQLTEFPRQFTSLRYLKCLYLGANNIESVPKEVGNLKRLEVLYLGGNRLQEIPEEVGGMRNLTSLVLCDNRLHSLPSSLVTLRRLQSLSLHSNQLSTLPPAVVKLNLTELSLRNNPLVVRFVQDMMYEPPSLLELSGRIIKAKGIPYSLEDLPHNLVEYLNSAHHCVNPKCKGVYFTSRVEHIQFVDFCGKYRLPLLEYLCSPQCTRQPVVCCSSSESESEDDAPTKRLKKVLLG